MDEAAHRSFFRELATEDAGEAALERLAPHAFPDVFFLDGVWRGLRDFEGGYARVRKKLHGLLAVLDDFGSWIFTDDTGRLSPQEPKSAEHVARPVTNAIVEKRFVGWGFDVAPEKPNVKANAKYRVARERALGARTLYCEWHYKFDGHTNRAHIHAPVEESGKKVIVAIFAQHLPPP